MKMHCVFFFIKRKGNMWKCFEDFFLYIWWEACTLPSIKVALLSFFRAILFFSFSVLLLSVLILSRFLLTDLTLTGTFPISIISLASLLSLQEKILVKHPSIYLLSHYRHCRLYGMDCYLKEIFNLNGIWASN